MRGPLVVGAVGIAGSHSRSRRGAKISPERKHDCLVPHKRISIIFLLQVLRDDHLSDSKGVRRSSG